MKKLFRKRTIKEDGLSAVWDQAIHRGALWDTIIYFVIIFVISIAIYSLCK